jgi:hypothetical protein
MKAYVRKIRWLKQMKVAISTGARCAKRVKSTKFVKQILSTCTRIVVISGFVKQSATSSRNRDNSEELPNIRRPRNFACKMARWGRVMFFPQKNVFIALISHKILYTKSLHITIEIRMKVRQSIQGRGHCFQQYH